MTPSEKARRIIEDFIDTHVRYFGDTTKTVLVDELMKRLAWPTDEEIENESFQFQGDSGDCAFKEGALWALAKMKGSNEKV